ncbi:F-box only protein 33 [Nilaparvata lugens]|uniref:F-box only protein 33 n=1 Tax=Nilaparvata lugens TaxID=108931 RepID=UPI00193D19C2|nr:F-box only protein 33 [Nilaparvata lugens]
MAAEIVYWNNLPSVLLYEIFSYLTESDRIRASSTCKHWRNALYHPSFWKNVSVNLNSNNLDNASKVQYLTSCLGSKLQNITVNFDILDPFCTREMKNVLRGLIGNYNLKSVSLIPTHSCFDYSKDYSAAGVGLENLRWFLNPILSILKKSHRLEALNLGCIEDLVLCGKTILERISNHHASHFRRLGLASMKSDPDLYDLFVLDHKVFYTLQNLQVLSLDFDYVNDDLLSVLSANGSLQRLVIHVHGILDTHPGTSEDAWDSFTKKNPMCELRLNLIYSYDGVNILDSILKSSMPLTHLKVFFCRKMNPAALQKLHEFSSTLRSLWWVDIMGNYSPFDFTDLESYPPENILVEQQLVNPLVICAWQCRNLEELVLFGYNIFIEDVRGIVKLRELKAFELLSSHILRPDGENLQEFEKEISSILSIPWRARTDDEVHPALLGEEGSCPDEFVLPIVLLDLK